MFSKTILVGRVGATKPENYREFDSGSKKFAFSVATSTSWYSKAENGYKSETTWHNIEVWDKTAEYCAKNLSKGDLLCVEGAIKVNEYDGKKFYYILAHKVYRLSKSAAEKAEKQGKLDMGVPF